MARTSGSDSECRGFDSLTRIQYDDGEKTEVKRGDGLWTGFWFTFLPLFMLALVVEIVFIDGCIGRR